MLHITPDLAVQESELDERFVRASGPGGQNVNKVATAVELRFDPRRSTVLTDAVRQRLRVLAGSRMTTDGIVVIDARRYRTQAQNRKDARERLAELLRQALVKPKRRKKTTTPRVAIERRLDSKRHRADKKRTRGKQTTED